MIYHFKIHEEKGGFWAECLEIPGIVTQADSPSELLANAKEALDVTLDEPESSKMIFPEPHATATSANILEVTVDPGIAFAMLVRQARVRRGMTQQQAARSMGFKGLYSYQRLECGCRCNPALSTIVKVHKLFPEIDLGLVC